jgi:hypothetical protein
MKKMFPLLLLVLVAGCGPKLHYQATVEVRLMDKEYRNPDPISRAQTVNVSAKAETGKFDIYIFLEKDKAEVEKNLSNPSAKLLDHKKNVSGETKLSANIPANEQAVVLIMSADGNKAVVNVTITN